MVKDPSWRDFWAELDKRNAAAEQEAADTKSEVEDVIFKGKKWRFVKVEPGPWWIARHSEAGEIRAPTSKSLVAAVKQRSEVKAAALPVSP